MNLGAFYVAMLFSQRHRRRDPGRLPRTRPPGSAAGRLSLTIFLVALTGLPPTGGFVAKLFLFGAAISAGWIWLVDHRRYHHRSYPRGSVDYSVAVCPAVMLSFRKKTRM